MSTASKAGRSAPGSDLAECSSGKHRKKRVRGGKGVEYLSVVGRYRKHQPAAVLPSVETVAQRVGVRTFKVLSALNCH